ncbi:NADPH-dependent oxidoreductase [Mesorhizobium sp. CU2]|nr:NADPH-dependent oxidoreductase [Mesorhizobium sp. CU3]TPO04722.1 NADPH-dependent oxidoreductase [Mesorhizobium sp. CU2]
MRTAVVVGNPKPASRTLDAARLLVERLTGTGPNVEFDLVKFGAALLDWDDETVKSAVATVAASDLVVVASPTFKATYSGLLKLFLDRFAGQTGMRGVIAIPLMLGAGERHALAVEAYLKPLLAELGATCPTPGLFLNDKTYADGPELDQFTQIWRPVVHALLEQRK